MCIKDMICSSKDMVFDRSIDVRMAIAKKGELDTPVKSFCIHKRCNTPIWKMILIMAGIVAGMMLVSKMCRRKRCKDCEE